MSSMHFNDLFGANAFTIILFGYFTLLAIGFLMMAGRSNTSDAQDTSSEQKAGTRRSRILTTIYLLLLFFTGVFAIFGSFCDRCDICVAVLGVSVLVRIWRFDSSAVSVRSILVKFDFMKDMGRAIDVTNGA